MLLHHAATRRYIELLRKISQFAEDFMTRLPQVCTALLLHQLICKSSQTFQHITTCYTISHFLTWDVC